jgi:nitrogen fixation protein FixH
VSGGPRTPAERRAAIVWPAFIVTLLAIPVIAAAVLVRASTSDPSFAVEEDYYEKALAWDVEMQQRAANERLGWTFELDADALGDRRLLVSARLLDASGREVPADVVRVEAFPLARASRIARADLALEDGGWWRAAVPLVHGGLWELRLEARAGERRFTEVLRRELPVTPERP